MMTKKNKYIDRLLYKSSYVINESPKYNMILDDLGDDDLLPNNLSTPINKNDSNIHEDDEEQLDMNNNSGNTETNIEPETNMADLSQTEPTTMSSVEPINKNDDVDIIQNEIIKLNISTMRKIHDQIESLNNSVLELSNKVNMLSSDVEEVKEPTDSEKLLNRKEDSYPYYLNLGDMWKNDTFQGRNDEFNEPGMRKLDDGTFIADFDSIKINLNNDSNIK